MATTRYVSVLVQFMWDGANWTNETNYLVGAKGALEYLPPNEAYASGKQIIQQMSVTLANVNNRFSMDRAESILYPYRLVGGAYHKKCRITVTVDNVSHVAFMGYVKNTAVDYKKNQVTFTVWDIAEILRQKFSTPMLRGALEHDVVISYLLLAGLVDGTHFISPTWAASHGGTTATIDYSSTPIEYSWLDDEPVWDEIVDLAQASGARIYITKEGMVRYEKGWQWTRSVLTETLTPELFQDFVPEQDDKSFYDEVQVTFTERSAGEGAGELWKLQRSRVILPGQTENITARYRYPAIDIAVPVAGTHYFLRYLNGGDATGSVSIDYTLNACQADITIINPTAQAVVFSQSRILGQALIGRPAEQVKRSFANNLFNRRVDIRENPYVQTKLQAEAIAHFMAWWYSFPKTIYTIKGVRGVASRKLGDQMRVVHEGVTYEGIVIKIEWRIGIINSAFAYMQDIKMIQNVFTDSHFVVGVDTLGGGKGVWH